MDWKVDRTINTNYEVYDSSGVDSTHEKLSDARKAFKKVKSDYGQGCILKIRTEVTTIITEDVIQGV